MKLTEARWGRLTQRLHEFEGWAGRLRADFGNVPADFVVTHRLVETDAAVVGDVESALAGLDANGYDVAVVDSAAEAFRIKVIERETSAANFVTLPAELLVLARLREPAPLVRSGWSRSSAARPSS